MLTTDQMMLFLAVVSDGSFSAAARKHGRTQSTVTYTVQAMESELGITLFDRSAYRPALTEAGRQILPRIARIVHDINGVVALSHAMAGGLEAQVTIVVDAIYPMDRMAVALREFQTAFPTVAAKLAVEALGGAFDMVLSGKADIGIVGYVPLRYAGQVDQHPMEMISFAVVAAPGHPLTSVGRPLGLDDVRDHLQLILTDRTTLTEGLNYGVYGTRTWSLADLGAKLAMLRAGLGWGGMPRHMVEGDLRDGRLVELEIAATDSPLLVSRLRPDLICLRSSPKGPATQWLLANLGRGTVAAPGMQRDPGGARQEPNES